MTPMHYFEDLLHRVKILKKKKHTHNIIVIFTCKHSLDYTSFTVRLLLCPLRYLLYLRTL